MCQLIYQPSQLYQILVVSSMLCNHHHYRGCRSSIHYRVPHIVIFELCKGHHEDPFPILGSITHHFILQYLPCKMPPHHSFHIYIGRHNTSHYPQSFPMHHLIEVVQIIPYASLSFLLMLYDILYNYNFW